MAVEILPLCFLLMYMSGTYCSVLNETSSEIDKLKYEVSPDLHKGPSNEENPNDENMRGSTVLIEKHPSTMNIEDKIKHTIKTSTEIELASSENPSASEVLQHSSQMTVKTSYSSAILDKTTPFAGNNKSETFLTSISVSSIPGIFSSTTDSPASLSNFTHSSVIQMASKDSVEKSSKNTSSQPSSAKMNFSQNEVLTNLTTEKLEPVPTSSSKRISKLVTAEISVGISLLVVVALVVCFMKYRKKTVSSQVEYVVLLP